VVDWMVVKASRRGIGGVDGCYCFAGQTNFREKKERLYLRFDFFFNELKKKGF